MDRKLQRHRADSLRQHGFLVLNDYTNLGVFTTGWQRSTDLTLTLTLGFYARQRICYRAYMLSPVRLSVRLSHGRL